MSDDRTAEEDVAGLLREQNALLREQQDARARRARAWRVVAWVIAGLLVIGIPVTMKVRADAASDRRVCELTQTMLGYSLPEARDYCR